MQSLVEQAKIMQITKPATLTSVNTGRAYVDMKNYGKCTFVLTAGVVTAGTKALVKEAKDKSGASAQTLEIDHYYKSAANNDVFTKTNPASHSSEACIELANADDNKTLVVEVDAAKMTDGFTHLTLQTVNAATNATFGIVGIASKARFQSQAPPTVAG